MSIIATVAHPKANSYLSLEEANEIFSVYPDIGWGDFSDLEKENILRAVTAKIDTLRYLGSKFFDNQPLEFPRKYDVRVVTPVYSSIVVSGIEQTSSFSVVSQNDYTYTISNPGSATFLLPAFPKQNTLSLIIVDTGDVYVDDGAGNLLDVGSGSIVGTVNYQERTITLSSPPDSDIQAHGDWILADKLSSQALVFDVAKFLPDLFKGGSIHIIYNDGSREYFDVIGHNLMTGEVTLSGSYKRYPPTHIILFAPYFPELKKAVELQVLAQLGADIADWDSLENRGIKSIKIGDTARSYSGVMPNTSKNAALAAKYRIHPVVLTLLARFTIYGKMESFYGKISV